MVLVDTDAICAAIKDVFEDTRSMLEPAGALAVAGAKAYAAKPQCCADSHAGRHGVRRQHELRSPALRRRTGRDRRVARGGAGGDVAGEAGRLPEFLSLIGARNITEFNYRYKDQPRKRMSSSAFRWLRAPSRLQLVEHLRRHGYPTLDLTDDEMAKLHVRYMVGGRSAGSRATSRSIASSSRTAGRVDELSRTR
jgi:threonine dehydratase